MVAGFTPRDLEALRSDWSEVDDLAGDVGMVAPAAALRADAQAIALP